MPTEDQRLTLTWDEITKIRQLAKAEGNLRHYYIVSILALSGRRIGELIPKEAKAGHRGIIPGTPGLRVEDINFKDGQISWVIEKKFKDAAHTERVKKIKDAPAALLKLLWEWIDMNRLQDGDILFNISIRRVQQEMERYCTLAGITEKARLIHALRHGFGLHAAKMQPNMEGLMHIQNTLEHVKSDQSIAYINMGSGERKKFLNKITFDDVELDDPANPS